MLWELVLPFTSLVLSSPTNALHPLLMHLCISFSLKHLWFAQLFITLWTTLSTCPHVISWSIPTIQTPWTFLTLFELPPHTINFSSQQYCVRSQSWISGSPCLRCWQPHCWCHIMIQKWPSSINLPWIGHPNFSTPLGCVRGRVQVMEISFFVQANYPTCLDTRVACSWMLSIIRNGNW